MKWVRLAFKVLVNGCLLALVVTAGLFGAGYFGLIDFYTPMVVTSGSMEPSIKTGSVALVKGAEDYGLGDVITFKSSRDQTTSHRVVASRIVDGELEFQTKGDANEEADTNWVGADKVVGRVVWSLPYLGRAVDVAQTPKGFIVLVIVPSVIIVYEELKTVWGELKKVTKLVSYRVTKMVVALRQPGSLYGSRSAPADAKAMAGRQDDPSAGSGQAAALKSLSALSGLKYWHARLFGWHEEFGFNGAAWLGAYEASKRSLWVYGLVVVVVAGVTSIGGVAAFYGDRDTSSENRLGAAESFEEPQENELPVVEQLEEQGEE